MRKVLAIAFCVVAAVAQAQPKHRLRAVPAANVKLHVVATQELAFAVIQEPSMPAPAEFTSKGALAFTHTNRPPNAQGQMEATVVVERMDIEVGVQGRTTKSNTAGMAGQVVTAVFDRSGAFVDVKVPDALKASAASLKQLLACAYSGSTFVPAAPLAVGETATVTGALPMTPPGIGNVPLTARTIVTLRGLATVSRQRIAHVTHRIESGTGGNGFAIVGDGTIDVNLDRGFVAASALHLTITGTQQAAAGTSAATAATPIRGTMKVTVTTTE